jgi:hypothetical protein
MTNEPKNLSPRLSKRLLAYATVAGAAAAVGSSSAEAEVVYTPVHQNVDLNFYLDLNNDGVPDFRIYSYQLSGFGELEAFPLAVGNRIVHQNGPCGFRTDHTRAAALFAGQKIGANQVFQAKANCMLYYESGFSSGAWYSAKDRFLGFSFVIEGQAHFGWTRLSFRNIGCYRCILGVIDYAYETIPNKAIIAGDEGQSAEISTVPSLGALALGNSGLDIWRTKEIVLNEVQSGDGK